MTDYMPTGDGMMAAIQALAVLVRSDDPASTALKPFRAAPQRLINVGYEGDSPLNRPDVKEAIESAKAEFGENGRVLIRASGTEPKIRVMTEGDDPDQVNWVAERLAEFIRNAQ